MRIWVQSLALLSGSQGSGVAMSYGLGHRLSLNPVLLWRRPAAAASIRPLAWELPYAVSAALKNKKLNKVKCLIHTEYFFFL